MSQLHTVLTIIGSSVGLAILLFSSYILARSNATAVLKAELDVFKGRNARLDDDYKALVDKMTLSLKDLQTTKDTELLRQREQLEAKIEVVRTEKHEMAQEAQTCKNLCLELELRCKELESRPDLALVMKREDDRDKALEGWHSLREANYTETSKVLKHVVEVLAALVETSQEMARVAKGTVNEVHPQPGTT